MSRGFPFGKIRAAMSQATVKLLQAAADIVGGEEALARHLSIGALLLRAYLDGRRELPDYLMLRCVDVVLEHAKPLAPQPPLAADDLPPVSVRVGK